MFIQSMASNLHLSMIFFYKNVLLFVCNWNYRQSMLILSMVSNLHLSQIFSYKNVLLFAFD